MKIEMIEVQSGDSVMVSYDVGQVSISQVDESCSNIASKIKEAFRQCKVFVLPYRGDGLGEIQITVVRHT